MTGLGEQQGGRALPCPAQGAPPRPTQGASLGPRGGAGGARVLPQGPQSAGAVPTVGVGGALFKGSCTSE